MPEVKKLTPTMRRILDLLDDGMPHTRLEVKGCLNDELAEMKSISKYITLVRQYLAPKGMGVLVQYVNNRMHYRKVRFINRSE